MLRAERQEGAPIHQGSRSFNAQKRLLALLLALCALLTLVGWPDPAWARPGQVTEFQRPPDSESEGITSGPEGNLWFTEGGLNAIGRITPNGQITEFQLPRAHCWPRRITLGPDGNIWFTESPHRYFPNTMGEGEGGPAIGRITPSGQITEFPLPEGYEAAGITAGPDGNLWFTEENAGAVGRITPGGQIREFLVPQISTPTGLKPPGITSGITSGPGHGLWFTAEHMIGRITPSGNISRYNLPKDLARPVSITAANGYLWFTADGRVCRMTLKGHIQRFTPQLGRPGVLETADITAGSDGNVWFMEDTYPFESNDAVGRITPSGQITTFKIGGNVSRGITSGPGHTIWYLASTLCEGGGISCMDWEQPPGIVGRITTGLLAVEIANERAQVRHGSATIRLGCAGGTKHSTCRGILSLRLESKAVVVYRGAYRVLSGKYRSFSLRLNPKELRLISRSYPLYSSLKATATVSGGRGTSREVTLEIRHP